MCKYSKVFADLDREVYTAEQLESVALAFSEAMGNEGSANEFGAGIHLLFKLLSNHTESLKAITDSCYALMRNEE